jgi:uncharacterized Zn finger protein
MTREQARAAVAKILHEDPTNFTMRSCWNCNEAHQHLKNRKVVLRCFACGHVFYNGVDVTEEP